MLYLVSSDNTSNRKKFFVFWRVGRGLRKIKIVLGVFLPPQPPLGPTNINIKHVLFTQSLLYIMKFAITYLSSASRHYTHPVNNKKTSLLLYFLLLDNLGGRTHLNHGNTFLMRITTALFYLFPSGCKYTVTLPFGREIQTLPWYIFFIRMATRYSICWTALLMFAPSQSNLTPVS